MRAAYNRLSAFKRVAASPEGEYEGARTLPELFRVLLEGSDGRSLKTTAKVKAAVAAMQAIVAADLEGWTYSGDDVRTYSDTTVTGGQKAVLPQLAALAKNRQQVAKNIEHTGKKLKGTLHIADMFILYAMLSAILLKGSTEARAEFLYRDIPQMAMRAGGTTLQTKLINAVRKAIPWKDATKMRQQRGLEASTKTANTSEVALLNAYVNVAAMPMQHRYVDVLISGIRNQGGERGYNQLRRPEDVFTLLTAAPFCDKSGAPRLEKSRQFVEFMADISRRLDVDYELTKTFAPQMDNKSLHEVVTSMKSTDDALKLIQLAPQPSWYNQLVDTGRASDCQRGAYSVYVLAYFGLAAMADDDTSRAVAMTAALAGIVQYKLMPPASLAERLRYFFPWPVVVAMLRHRLA